MLVVCQYFWPENLRINDLAVDFRDRGHGPAGDASALVGLALKIVRDDETQGTDWSKRPYACVNAFSFERCVRSHLGV